MTGYEFLIKNGTNLQTNINYHDAEAMKRLYINSYNQVIIGVPRSREVHSVRGMVITTIPFAEYINNHHKALCGGSSEEPVSFSIQPKTGFFSQLRRFFTHYPLISQALKWTLIALSVTALLYFTGGLAAIPLLAPVVAKIGALSLLAFSPVIGATLAALWYGAAKSVLSWCANKFFYPHYAIRKIDGPKAEAPDSPRRLIASLGVDDSSAANQDALDSAPYQGQSPLYFAKKTAKEEERDNRITMNCNNLF